MEHMGKFKCVFSNEAGSDETEGKVTVKPVRMTTFIFLFVYLPFVVEYYMFSKFSISSARGLSKIIFFNLKVVSKSQRFL